MVLCASCGDSLVYPYECLWCMPTERKRQADQAVAVASTPGPETPVQLTLFDVTQLRPVASLLGAL
jgi:hypothetical protein